MTKLAKIFYTVFLIYFLPTASYGFYESKTPFGETEVKGFFRTYGVINDNPGNKFFYNNDRDTYRTAVFRLLIDNRIYYNLNFEFNGFLNYTGFSDNTFLNRTGSSRHTTLNLSDVDTSKENRIKTTTVDRLNFSYSTEKYNITLGRAPQNLTILYHFKPNDFFKPFNATTFFRDFKEGVDSARLDYKINNLSELTFLTVAGYDDRNKFQSELASLVVKYLFTIKDIEASFLAGRLYDEKVVGGHLQGEFLNFLTYRFEGHRAINRTDNKETDRLGLALEKYFDNDSNILIEGFYNGKGLTKKEYDEALFTNTVPEDYIGLRYLSFGGGKLITPLLKAQGALLFNLSDFSKLLSLYLTYSLSNESDISLTAAIPYGHDSNNFKIQSEYGLMPYSLGLDFRIYF